MVYFWSIFEHFYLPITVVADKKCQKYRKKQHRNIHNLKSNTQLPQVSSFFKTQESETLYVNSRPTILYNLILRSINETLGNLKQKYS